MSHLIRASSTARVVRPFSITVPARREGEIISSKPCGFLAEMDPFIRRPAVNDSYFSKTQDAEKLKLVRQKMYEQRRHLDELERHIQYLAQEQGVPRY
ncbi:hypothetical protein BO71DRAFT_396027 [Aspergillus ellipticus CBS 707.79]|uniref:ATPase inhibitor, mitochondrial n=1 Tax=Aspergillus ellipticus CBS 707.79 TaxID=1448320 RepID=A0A319DLJ5_9EURO|nr:hypothetical protein BO71DRAFT_396027 [Aspergillus ellipticus CBS 707.79]